MPFDYAALEARRIKRTGDAKPLTFTRSAHSAACNLRNGRTDCSCGKERTSRKRSFVRTDYAVAKVSDEGKVLAIVKPNLDAMTAEAQAGQMRDRMTDAQVAKALAEGWTYMHVPLRGNRKRVSPWESGR